MLIRISSRSSFLAKWQAYQFGNALLHASPGIKVEYHFRESLGDKNLTDPLWQMPGKGVFTEDFYSDLVESKTDIVVHSWKDLPTEKKDKTIIAATLKRADQRDLLLFKKTSAGKRNLNIFSSSPRRAYHVESTLKWSLPYGVDQVKFSDVRGNIQTRINKLIENPYIDGLVVAKAALDRLMDADFYKAPDFLALQKTLKSQLSSFNYQILPLSENPTAAAQGALAAEILSSRLDLQELLQKVNNTVDFASCEFERKELAGHGGGCHQKIGLSAVNIAGHTVFFAAGLSPRGKKIAKKGLLHPKKFSFADADVMTSDNLWQNVERIAVEQKRELECKAVFITKKEALNGITLKNTFNFTAGIKTWKALAADGVWVHGSTDSLGEDHLPEVTGWIREALGLSDRYWYKLTHQDSPVLKSAQPIVQIGTYQVQHEPKLIPPPPDLKMIFWKSGFEFLEAVKHWPALLKIEHACGLGQTAKTLSSILPPEKVTLYFDENDWRNSVISEI